VRPWKSTVTAVSSRTGAERSTAIVTMTSLGASAFKAMSVTSPTRMPLNSTLEPCRRPETELSNRMR